MLDKLNYMWYNGSTVKGTKDISDRVLHWFNSNDRFQNNLNYI